MNKRLLMIVHGAYPQDVRVARQARAALDGGWEVDVLATIEDEQPRAEVVDGVRVRRLPVGHRHGAGALATALEYVAFTMLATLAAAHMSLRRRYAVVQVHNPPDFLLLASLGPRLLGAGTVLDIHDLSPDMFAMRFAERRGARAADRALRLVERWAIRVAGIVLTVHEPYRRELVARGAPADQTIVVMNSIDERLLPPAAEAVAGGFRVVYHGTITPHYGVGLLVEAAAEIGESIPDLRVELYGAGDALAQIEARARDLGIASKVITSPEFLGQREVLGRVAGASVGVIPNLPTQLNRYALSTKLFEYVALGIPVVCAGLPTLREHFSDEEVLFFQPGDASDLARVLRAVAADPAAASVRGAAARRRAVAYSWSDNAARYVDALDRARRR